MKDRIGSIALLVIIGYIALMVLMQTAQRDLCPQGQHADYWGGAYEADYACVEGAD